MSHHHSDLSTLISPVGSTAAVVGGMASVVFAQAEMPNSSNASVAALVVAFGGLASATLPQVLAALKLYIEERKAKWERHDFANRVNAQGLLIEDMKAEIAALKHQVESKTEENRELIHLIAHQFDAPSGEHPDPQGDLERALKRCEVKPSDGPAPQPTDIHDEAAPDA